ncbi:hypothetical protein N7539_003642 [Penicillium diatomitis]|uniref:Uncharacterized protein n=1 Tax=Penicillium diatomitis TaxID=2819901 RepID=A0A9W9XDI5_9EURO|nr:uncharacterized protein N7539_003642 [Penicillium diatomitis]KAJ5488752.1 hypothetical protein N7539_003642 [Penicillium diatomitis]
MPFGRDQDSRCGGSTWWETFHVSPSSDGRSSFLPERVNIQLTRSQSEAKIFGTPGDIEKSVTFLLDHRHQWDNNHVMSPTTWGYQDIDRLQSLESIVRIPVGIPTVTPMQSNGNTMVNGQ